MGKQYLLMFQNTPAGGEAWLRHRFKQPCRKEEEAKADDETKDLRASAPLIDRRSGWNPLALRALDG
jgi:hypothetical protein